MSDDFALGKLVGQRDAFNVVASRCSAADAALLREMRDKKLYLSHAGDWDEFCTKHLHTTKESANRVIRHLNEFGPAYFHLSQITRISPATYRAIAPPVRDQALHHKGEAIALLPENAEKVAAAVNDLRKSASSARPSRPSRKGDPIPKLERRCTELAADLEITVAQRRDDRERVRAVIGYLRTRIDRIELTL